MSIETISAELKAAQDVIRDKDSSIDTLDMLLRKSRKTTERFQQRLRTQHHTLTEMQTALQTLVKACEPTTHGQPWLTCHVCHTRSERLDSPVNHESGCPYVAALALLSFDPDDLSLPASAA